MSLAGIRLDNEVGHLKCLSVEVFVEVFVMVQLSASAFSIGAGIGTCIGICIGMDVGFEDLVFGWYVQGFDIEIGCGYVMGVGICGWICDDSFGINICIGDGSCTCNGIGIDIGIKYLVLGIISGHSDAQMLQWASF